MFGFISIFFLSSFLVFVLEIFSMFLNFQFSQELNKSGFQVTEVFSFSNVGPAKVQYPHAPTPPLN